MQLDISVDNDAEEINIILDNHVALSVFSDGGHLTYSNNFSDVCDDDTYHTIKEICQVIAKRLL